jgi:hypothetical protein
MEPIVPGTVVPNGTKVPGTEFQMDPVCVLFIRPRFSRRKETDEGRKTVVALSLSERRFAGWTSTSAYFLPCTSASQ